MSNITRSINVADIDFTISPDGELAIDAFYFDQDDIKEIIGFLLSEGRNDRLAAIEARLDAIENPPDIFDAFFGKPEGGGEPLAGRILKTAEPRVYHGFRVGERVKQFPDSSEVATVIERPSEGYGSEEMWVPVQYDHGGRDGFDPDGGCVRADLSMPDGPSGETDKSPEEVIGTAISQGLNVRFDYRGLFDPVATQRVVTPERLDASGSSMYFEGEYANGDGYRRFLLDSVEGPVLLDA